MLGDCGIWGPSSGIVVLGPTFGDCEFCIQCIIEGTGYAEACLSTVQDASASRLARFVNSKHSEFLSEKKI